MTSALLPVVAIIGRPNVGKSTLFNRLTRSRNALVSRYPGMTRDRQYGHVNFAERHFILIDTGGLTEQTDDLSKMITQQVSQALREADKIIFLVDAQTGPTPTDTQIAERLRKLAKPYQLVINKIDGQDSQQCISDFYELGMGNPIAISASHAKGLNALVETLFPTSPPYEEETDQSRIKIAIVGQPNVGKSTLTNRLLGEDRVLVHDTPGTTRDSIFINLQRFDNHYTLIDTAGVRKSKKGAEEPEKFSIVKTLQAIENTQVVLYVIDARKTVSEQDLKLLSFILECGKACVIAINKWDGLSSEERKKTKASIDRQLDFLGLIRIHFISALHGTGVGNLFDSINEAYQSATKKLATPQLTRLLQEAQLTHSPPLKQGRRIKLRYAHAGGHNPPRIVIHGNQLAKLAVSYQRFLANFFQRKLKLYGTPVFIEFKTTINPFAKKKK